jgi:hypothetical protein
MAVSSPAMTALMLHGSRSTAVGMTPIAMDHAFYYGLVDIFVVGA